MPVTIEIVVAYADTTTITLERGDAAFDEALSIYLIPLRALEPILRPPDQAERPPAPVSVPSFLPATCWTLTRSWRQGYSSGGLPY